MTDDPTDGITYIEVLMLRRKDAITRAHAMGNALITPWQAACADLSPADQLRFSVNFVAYLLGVAEGIVGADGRDAIVQCMRNVPASTARVMQ